MNQEQQHSDVNPLNTPNQVNDGEFLISKRQTIQLQQYMAATQETIYDIGIISGGFDPIHDGHISMISEALQKCRTLYIGLNSDAWLMRKKGYYFMNWSKRADIIRSIAYLYNSNVSIHKDIFVISFDDSDNTACNLLEYVNHYIDKTQPMTEKKSIAFFNGGDRTPTNIPESVVAHHLGISLKFGIGGFHKQSSSSDFLKDLEKRHPKQKKEEWVDRPWGRYSVLAVDGFTKIKKLIVYPGKSLSLQRHANRSETWRCVSGIGELHNFTGHCSDITRDSVLIIDVGQWHRLINTSNTFPLEIIEIQSGINCVPDEADIERWEDTSSEKTVNF